METVKVSEVSAIVKFEDGDGRQTVKAQRITTEGKFIVVGEQFIALADVDKWIEAMRAAKAVAEKM